jgi:hypothetical protein
MVRHGGGYIGGQFNGYEQEVGQQMDMPDLVLQLWPHPDNCTDCAMTWTVVPGQEGHPVLGGVPASFTFPADAHDAGPLVEFVEDPSTVLMTSPHDGPAVVVREFEEGRVVSFSSGTNVVTRPDQILTLEDFNIQTLYLNAVNWACNVAPPVPQCNAPETIFPWHAPISFTATVDSGPGSVEITDYDCFRINGAGKKIDKTKSCKVTVAEDTITIRTTGGVGTQITWTAVAIDGSGNMSEEASCGVQVGIPGKAKGKLKKLKKLWKKKCKGKDDDD